MGRILLGISAWADRQLVEAGTFYPPDVKTSADRLRFYSSKFSLAEIDASYHFFPTRNNMSLWLENTPDSFVFDIKAFSLFTGHPTVRSAIPRAFREKYGDAIPDKANLYPHHLPEGVLGELWRVFGEVIKPVEAAGKLGVVFFQFPPWFHPSDASRDYIADCRRRLPQYRLAVEFRVGSWFDEDNRERTLGLLRQQDISLICVDEPQGLPSSVPPLAEVTASHAIVRFRGRNAANWESKGAFDPDRFNYLYSREELAAWLLGIVRMSKSATEVHIVFKNKHADYPVRNAQQMRQLLEAAGLEVK